MTKEGLKTAFAFGENLPSFGSLEEAQTKLFELRDERLENLERESKSQSEFVMDYSPNSLLALELWYFKLHRELFEKVNLDKVNFESCMAMYFGEVAVRNNENVKWLVSPFRFIPDKYELGVQRNLLIVQLTVKYKDLYSLRNPKKDRLFKDYQRWFLS